MAAGVFDELTAPQPRRDVTVGITDDVTGLSVTPDPGVTVAATPLQAVFYGLGSDGTVGSVKATAKLLSEHTGRDTQGTSSTTRRGPGRSPSPTFGPGHHRSMPATSSSPRTSSPSTSTPCSPDAALSRSRDPAPGCC